MVAVLFDQSELLIEESGFDIRQVVELLLLFCLVIRMGLVPVLKAKQLYIVFCLKRVATGPNLY